MLQNRAPCVQGPVTDLLLNVGPGMGIVKSVPARSARAVRCSRNSPKNARSGQYTSVTVTVKQANSCSSHVWPFRDLALRLSTICSRSRAAAKTYCASEKLPKNKGLLDVG